MGVNRGDGVSNHILLVSVAVTLGSYIPIGYHIGVINAPADLVKAWCGTTLIERYNWHLSAAGIEILWSSIVSILLLSGAVSSLGGAWIADRLGRKGALLCCGILSVAGAVVFFFCRIAGSVEMLLLGRLLVGFASGLTTSTLPMYLSELAPLQLRGTFSVLVGMGLTVGLVIGQVVSLQEVFGTADLWHVAFSVYGVLPLMCLLPYHWFPESPNFLYIVQKNPVGAQKELMLLRNNRSDLVEAELATLHLESLCQSEKRSIWSVLRDPTLFLPVVLVCALQSGQQLVGINAVFYYSVSIFQSAGLSYANAQWANLGAGILNAIVASSSPLLMAKINRRPLILWSCLFTGVFIIVLTLVVEFIDKASWLPTACIVAVLAYIVSFQFGLGGIPHFIGSELFESGPRPAAMALGSLSSWTGNFIVGMAFPSLLQAWGAPVFIPFAVVSFALWTLLRFYLPETRGKDIALVVPLMRNGFKSKPLALDKSIT